LDTPEIRSEISVKFSNVVKEKVGYQLDRSVETLRSVSKSQGGDQCHTNNKKKKDKLKL
jgi:hypothetical protein